MTIPDAEIEAAVSAVKHVYATHIIATVTAGNTPVSVYRIDGEREIRVFGPAPDDECGRFLTRLCQVAALSAAARVRGDGWMPIETVPKNAKPIILKVPKRSWPGFYEVIGHWASDLSGSEQPPFEGWFRDTGDGFAEIQPDPIAYRPLPAPPQERT